MKSALNYFDNLFCKASNMVVISGIRNRQMELYNGKEIAVNSDTEQQLFLFSGYANKKDYVFYEQKLGNDGLYTRILTSATLDNLDNKNVLILFVNDISATHTYININRAKAAGFEVIVVDRILCKAEDQWFSKRAIIQDRKLLAKEVAKFIPKNSRIFTLSSCHTSAYMPQFIKYIVENRSDLEFSTAIMMKSINSYRWEYIITNAIVNTFIYAKVVADVIKNEYNISDENLKTLTIAYIICLFIASNYYENKYGKILNQLDNVLFINISNKIKDYIARQETDSVDLLNKENSDLLSEDEINFIISKLLNEEFLNFNLFAFAILSSVNISFLNAQDISIDSIVDLVKNKEFTLPIDQGFGYPPMLLSQDFISENGQLDFEFANLNKMINSYNISVILYNPYDFSSDNKYFHSFSTENYSMMLNNVKYNMPCALILDLCVNAENLGPQYLSKNNSQGSMAIILSLFTILSNDYLSDNSLLLSRLAFILDQKRLLRYLTNECFPLTYSSPINQCNYSIEEAERNQLFIKCREKQKQLSESLCFLRFLRMQIPGLFLMSDNGLGFKYSESKRIKNGDFGLLNPDVILQQRSLYFVFYNKESLPSWCELNVIKDSKDKILNSLKKEAYQCLETINERLNFGNYISLAEQLNDILYANHMKCKKSVSRVKKILNTEQLIFVRISGDELLNFCKFYIPMYLKLSPMLLSVISNGIRVNYTDLLNLSDIDNTQVEENIISICPIRYNIKSSFIRFLQTNKIKKDIKLSSVFDILLIKRIQILLFRNGFYVEDFCENCSDIEYLSSFIIYLSNILISTIINENNDITIRFTLNEIDFVICYNCMCIDEMQEIISALLQTIISNEPNKFVILGNEDYVMQNKSKSLTEDERAIIMADDNNDSSFICCAPCLRLSLQPSKKNQSYDTNDCNSLPPLRYENILDNYYDKECLF